MHHRPTKSKSPSDRLLAALESLDGEALDGFLIDLAALPCVQKAGYRLAKRRPRGEYFRARNQHIRQLSQRGLSAAQIAALPGIDVGRDAVLKVLRRSRRQRSADISEMSTSPLATRCENGRIGGART